MAVRGGAGGAVDVQPAGGGADHLTVPIAGAVRRHHGVMHRLSVEARRADVPGAAGMPDDALMPVERREPHGISAVSLYQSRSG